MQAHRIEWFQKTQMGLVRSSVSSSRNCTVTGLSRARGRSSSSSWTLMLTTGVLMTGRLGTLKGGEQGHNPNGGRVNGVCPSSWASCHYASHEASDPLCNPAPPTPLRTLTSGCVCPGRSCGAAARPGCDR